MFFFFPQVYLTKDDKDLRVDVVLILRRQKSLCYKITNLVSVFNVVYLPCFTFLGLFYMRINITVLWHDRCCNEKNAVYTALLCKSNFFFPCSFQK